MRKILIGLVVLVLLAAGGYFGVTKWAQVRAEKEVDAAFETMRAAGLTAAHGAVGFDLIRRTLFVDDVVIQSSAWAMNLRAPKVEFIGLSMPDAPARQPDGSSNIAAARAALAAVKVASITVPSVDVAVQTLMPATAGAPSSPVDVVYAVSGIALTDVRERRVASLSIERTGFKLSSTVPELGNFDGEFTKWTANDIDLDVVLAMLDPAETTKEGPYRRAYGPVTAGPSKFEFQKGGRVEIEAFAGDAFEIKPGKYNLAAVMAMLEATRKAGGTPSPKEMGQLSERFAGLYEGLRMGRMEARGLRVVVPAGGESKVEAVRFNGFENGRLGELAVENVDIRVPQQEPFTLARFSLMGLHFANMLRLGGRIAEQGRVGPELSASPLPLVEGIAMDRLRLPIKPGREPIVVDMFDFSWSQFVGPIPTKAGLKLKFSTPLIADDQDFVRLLAAEGITALAASFDMAAGWTEATKTFAVAPFALDLTDWFSAKAALSLGNVPRDVFAIDPDYAAKVAILALGMEAGAFELTLRDSGGLDRLVGLYAKTQGLSRADARKEILAAFSKSAEPLLADHPELSPVVDAALKFLEAPKATLSIKLVPNGHVPLALLALAARTDPLAALANFKIEATATR